MRTPLDTEGGTLINNGAPPMTVTDPARTEQKQPEPAAVDVHRIAIAHEWLVSYSGSERVVKELLGAFPDSRLLTSLAETSNFPAEFARAEPSLLQQVPGATAHHEWMLPLMPMAWRLRKRIEDVDAVVTSSHACANAVRVAPQTPVLSYCHTPMRYAWDFASERARFPRPIRTPARALMAGFRHWDKATAGRVTRFVANSTMVAGRIKESYGRESSVVHPPVDTEFFTPDSGPAGEDFIYVGRLVGYKRADLAVEAFADLPYRLLVVGVGHMKNELMARATPNVTFLGSVDDDTLRNLYRRARAMVFPAVEDFGISMAEAQSCGTPVLSVAKGGALDIVKPGESGLLAQPDDVADLRRVIRQAASGEWDRSVIRQHSESFSAANFRTRMREAVAEMVTDPRPR